MTKYDARYLKITEKSHIQQCEQSELCLQFEWTKVHSKKPKMVNFGKVLKTYSLQFNSVTRQDIFISDKNWCKMPKLKNSYATFWVIFKHCAYSCSNSRLLYSKVSPNFNSSYHLIHPTDFWYLKARMTQQTGMKKLCFFL